MIYLNPMAQARIKAQERFKCEECGHCCTQCAPITINENDLKRIALHFGKSLKIAFKRHCKVSEDGKMIAFKHDRPCKFYDSNKGCKIYEVRPTVCRLHPFLSGEPRDSETFIVPEFCKPAVRVYEGMRERGEVA